MAGNMPATRQAVKEAARTACNVLTRRLYLLRIMACAA